MQTAIAASGPPEFPRRFVAADADFSTWPVAAPYYKALAERALGTVDQLDDWLLDWSELDAAFDEECTRRYIEMSCQTDDPAREARFLDFVENVKPHREPWLNRLNERFVEAAGRFALPAKRYDALSRSIRNSVALYRDANVALQTEDEKVVADYQRAVGAMTGSFRGEEKTIPQLTAILEEPDRATREEVWRLAADRFLNDGALLDDIYVRLVALRARIAANAGCADFREYKFREMERFDYTPEDCLAFHAAIERVVVPAARQLNDFRRRRLGVETLRPWDLQVDPLNREPLRPFNTADELNDGCAAIFANVHRDFGVIFQTLRDQQMLDLDSRKGKAPGGYQAVFNERRMPFIFMNAVGTDDDVRTLLHEGGHAFHSWACRNEPFLAYREAPTEFSEVASMGMECLAAPFMDRFYASNTRRAQRDFFEGIVRFFPFMACVDAFQHYVYSNGDAGIDGWKDAWVGLAKRFNTGVDWTGLEDYERRAWHRKLHIFEVPFYYIEYGIAQLGALQVWLNSRRNYEEAVAFYRQGLSLGGSRPLPELFEAANCKLDFSESALRPLINAVMEEIVRLT